MKKYIAGFIIGALVAIAVSNLVGVWQDAKLKDENAGLKADIKELDLKWASLEATSNKKIADLLESIGGLNGNIDSLMFVNSNLEEANRKRERENSVISAENKKMKTEIQPVLDANPRVKEFVSNLETINENQAKVIFTLKEQRTNDQSIILSWSEKYIAQVRISEEYALQLSAVKDRLDKEKTLTSLQGKMIQKLRRQKGAIGILTAVGWVGLGAAILL
jgi:chromosome segregation ATPase